MLDLNIFSFLEGKTLLYLYTKKELSIFDKDDDIGIFHKDYTMIKNNLDVFKKNGFNVIRDNGQIISFERKFRYIDVCIFKDVSKQKIGYSGKEFNKKYFLEFNRLKYKNYSFFTPSNSKEFLNERYPSKLLKNYFIKKNIRKLKNLLIYFYEFFLSIFHKNIKRIPKNKRSEYNNTGISGKYTINLSAKDIFLRNIHEDRKENIPYLKTKHFEIFNVIQNSKHSNFQGDIKDQEIVQKLQSLIDQNTSNEEVNNYVIVEYDKFLNRQYILFEPCFKIEKDFNNNSQHKEFIIL